VKENFALESKNKRRSGTSFFLEKNHSMNIPLDSLQEVEHKAPRSSIVSIAVAAILALSDTV
jgi:hypothetical protein